MEHLLYIFVMMIKVAVFMHLQASERQREHGGVHSTENGKLLFMTIHKYVDRFLPIILWFL